VTRPRRTRSAPARQYPRTARLGELLREIVAEELERIDDVRLELVTVTDTKVDADLKRATVWVSSLEGEARDAEVMEALAQHRPRLQHAFAQQARTRWTPELTFKPDDVVRSALRIEDLLREHPPAPDGIEVPDNYVVPGEQWLEDDDDEDDDEDTSVDEDGPDTDGTGSDTDDEG
jgi:ribosome-binding factor A